MEFTSLSQCRSDLSFSPVSSWPQALPVFSYQGQLLCGFERLGKLQVVELSGAIEELLFAIYPKLSFVELARLHSGLNKSKLVFDSILFFQNWGFHFNDYLSAAVEGLQVLPQEFLNFAAKKNLSPRDLEPLSLKQDVSAELLKLAKSEASRSEAVQIIELIADLKMLKKWPDTLDWSVNSSDLIEGLRAIRYPRRTALQNESRLKVKKLSWPKGVKWTWKTSSDQNVLDLHLSLKSVQELEKASQKLLQVTEQASAEECNPWQ